MALNIVSAFRDIANDERLVQDMSEVIVQEALTNQAEDFFTIRPGIKGGQQVVAMSPDEYVTKNQPGCENLTFDSFEIDGIAQKWEPKSMDVKIKMCYTDFEEAFTTWALANGYDRRNLDESMLMDFITNRTINAMRKDFTRVAIFGDEDILANGNLTDNGKAPHYNQIPKGLLATLKYFKTISALDGQFIDIAKNGEATTAAQLALANGEATSIYDQMVEAIAYEAEYGQILTSNTLFRNYKNQFRANLLESGVQALQQSFAPTFDGRALTDMKFSYDKYVKNDFTKDGAMHIPHLAVLADRSNLVIGVDDTAALTDLRFEYPGGADENFYIKASYLMDFKIPNPYAVVAAL